MTGSDSVDPAVARLLEDPAVWAEVTPGLRELTLTEALGADADVDALVTRRDIGPSGRVRGRSNGGWRRPVLLAAAMVVVFGLAVAGGMRLTGESEPGGVEVALSGTVDAPGASATAELRNEPSGVSVELDVRGLPPAPAGFFYEAWLVGETGKVSAGTFHQRGQQDSIRLWLGVDPDDYDALTVTRQPIAGGTLAEGVVVMRGELPAQL